MDWIEYGNYVARTKTAYLAVRDPGSGKPSLVTAHWPVVVRDATDAPVHDARFMVSYLHLEEKGSDVNVATHLLDDVLGRRVDAAMVISNDSDLALPLRLARAHVPVATVNPHGVNTAGKLKGLQSEGVGGHWWWRLGESTYRACQLSNPCGGQLCPPGW